MSKGLIAFICVACCVAVGVIGLSIGIIAGKALGKIDFNDKDPSFSVIGATKPALLPISTLTPRVPPTAP